MKPELNGFDHVHVYVNDRNQAEQWYAKVLGFKRVEKLMVWAVDGGPLTLQDPGGKIHLALFEKNNHEGSSAIAFAATGIEFLAWKAELEAQGLELRFADHELAYSIYFSDPDNNMHEITTYQHDYVAERIN